MQVFFTHFCKFNCEVQHAKQTVTQRNSAGGLGRDYPQTQETF